MLTRVLKYWQPQFEYLGTCSADAKHLRNLSSATAVHRSLQNVNNATGQRWRQVSKIHLTLKLLTVLRKNGEQEIAVVCSLTPEWLAESNYTAQLVAQASRTTQQHWPPACTRNRSQILPSFSYWKSLAKCVQFVQLRNKHHSHFKWHCLFSAADTCRGTVVTMIQIITIFSDGWTVGVKVSPTTENEDKQFCACLQDHQV